MLKARYFSLFCLKEDMKRGSIVRARIKFENGDVTTRLCVVIGNNEVLEILDVHNITTTD